MSEALEHDGRYFASADEANDWLEFDADDETQEQYAYALAAYA